MEYLKEEMKSLDKHQSVADKVNGLESKDKESNVAQPTDQEKENLGDKPKLVQIKAKQCDAERKFEKILGHIEKIKDDSKKDLNKLKLDIESFESHFNEKFENIAARVESNSERYNTRNAKLQEKLDQMEERVKTTRQIAGASNMAEGRVSYFCQTQLSL